MELKQVKMIEYTVRVFDNGNKAWYLNDKLHREDGPAVEYADGDKYWYINGELHRENGPAIEFADGTKDWWINGKQVSESEVMRPKHTITIDGKEIQISHESFKELKEQLR